MTEKSFTITPDGLVRKNVWFAMGYRDNVPESGICDMVDEAVTELVPNAVMRYMYGIVPAEKLSATQIRMGGTIFTPGGIICSYLNGMTEACVFVATAGKEFEEGLRKLGERGDIVNGKSFSCKFRCDNVAELGGIEQHQFKGGGPIGTVLAELAVERLEKDICPGKTVSLPYSPGYCGWDIREQQLFFPLFPPEPCGIRLSDSSLMKPEKSISGFAAMGRELVRQPYHCEICRNTKCYKRRKS